MPQELRTCKKCLQDRPLLAAVRDGIVYRRHLCSPCYTAVKNAARQAKAEWFDEYKRTQFCAHCGNADHRVLQFHHLNTAEKERAVSDMLRLNMSQKRILAEVAKCACLCGNCHLIVHYEERRHSQPSFA